MKFIRLISFVVIGATLVCLYSFALRISFEGNRLGKLSPFLRDFSELPRIVYQVFREVKNPERFVKVVTDFRPINQLDYSIKYLGSEFKNDQWEIYLKDLRNDSTYFSWYLDEKNYYLTERIFSHTDPRTPILLADSSIVINCDESNNLYRIDKNSNIVWHNTNYRYHHSTNLAADGHIWTCTKTFAEEVVGKQKLTYEDNAITKIDVETGKMLFHKSISDIFSENGLSYYIHGFNNNSLAGGIDPFHLNDIEPILDSTNYWVPGDVLISLRNRSMILLYDVTAEKVKRIIQGPFYNQHDVDVIDDSTILIFNNNVSSLETSSLSNAEYEAEEKSTLNKHAELIVYHLNDSSYSQLYSNEMAKEGVYTLTQGLQERLPNGDVLVESQNSGLVYVFSDSKLLYKNYIHDIMPGGLVEPPHWIRVTH